MTPENPPPPPPPSLVLLLKAPAAFSRPVVRAAAERAFGVPFGSDPDSRRYVVPFRGREGQYAIRFTEYMLGVSQGDKPYWSDPTFGPDLLGDPRAGAAVVANRGWVAVDGLGLFDHPPRVVPDDRKTDVYRVMSRLALEFFNLVEEHCTALVVPEVRRVYPNSADRPADATAPGGAPLDSIRDMLSTKEPAMLLGVNGPAMLDENDPRIVAATAEARRRMPEFLKAWEGRSADSPGPWWVKARFTDEHGGEQMWLSVDSIRGGLVTGVLQSDPAYVRCVRQGQKVELKLEEVDDFLYHDGRGMHGAFIDHVIRDIMEGREVR